LIKKDLFTWSVQKYENGLALSKHTTRQCKKH
ncbi:MAG: hypothetical protein ACI9XB_004090, partial [Gammaproteobacteria bacterium]